MRARQAAAGVPLRVSGPRDADELVAPAVAETVAALELQPEDAAAVQLARRYAAGPRREGIACQPCLLMSSLGRSPARDADAT
jgi:hypothetical protein